MIGLLLTLLSAMVCYSAPPPKAPGPDGNIPPTAIIMSCYGEQLDPVDCTTGGTYGDCPHERPRGMGYGCSTTGGIWPDPSTVCMRIDDIPPPGAAFMFCVRGGESVAGSLDPNQPCGSDIRVAP